jgi:alkylation response protein AidB-like acyl-CoA dehydrogenase
MSTFHGGEFLLHEAGQVMAPEFFSPEQRALFETAMRFSREQVLPKATRIEAKDFGLLRELLREAGELGLLGVDVPEAYGGLGLDKTTSLLVAEAKSLLGSWSVTFSAQTGIGTLPIVYFGTEAQKQQYLPGLASGQKVAAYALTEAGSGSDALGARTTAVKSADGKHWVLNGAKQYITNAGFADVFIVFAKVDGARFSAFIVDRSTAGLTIGPEEHKMGIRGSSTCPVILEDAKVPVENLLGEIGRGHIIAFNILNLGRLKLGSGVLGSMKTQLASALSYVTDRRQFDTPLLRFGLTREKLARMAAAIYAVESMAYRTSGLIDSFGGEPLKAIEEFSIEASIAKVVGSEALGQVMDDAVQLHGGAGYIEEYPVERAYRDARINRIFEGTNEINRLLVTGTLLKRAAKGALSLFDATTAQTPPLKALARVCLKLAVEAFGPALDQHQVVQAALADLVIEAFVVDSVQARNRALAAVRPLEPWRVALEEHLASAAQERAQQAAHRVIGACSTGDARAAHLKAARALQVDFPGNPEQLIETVVTALEAARGYPPV